MEEKALTKDDPVLINVRNSLTVEEALGISNARFMQLSFIIDDIWAKKPTKAEAILAIANHPDITDLEKTYMGYKVHERLVNIVSQKIPVFGTLIRKRLP